MESEVKCWACMEKSGPAVPWQYKARALGEHDVDIKILVCGICGSDVHQIDSGWGHSIYPIVPGHEIIGKIIALGSSVKDLKLGQRVGVGPQCWSCGKCEWCKDGDEIMCRSERVWTYNAKLPNGTIVYGGYAESILVDSRFVIPIPDNLSTEGAAPLLCAGVTTYTPLARYNYGPGHKIGVIGIGGLGHMAIKWAKALGCEVTALSHSAKKEDDAKKLGADHFLYYGDKEKLKSASRSLDAILNTASSVLDFSVFINLLKPYARLILVGVPEEKLAFQPFDFIDKSISVCGSLVGSPKDFKAMFELASKKKCCF